MWWTRKPDLLKDVLHFFLLSLLVDVGDKYNPALKRLLG